MTTLASSFRCRSRPTTTSSWPDLPGLVPGIRPSTLRLPVVALSLPSRRPARDSAAGVGRQRDFVVVDPFGERQAVELGLPQRTVRRDAALL